MTDAVFHGHDWKVELKILLECHDKQRENGV